MMADAENILNDDELFRYSAYSPKEGVEQHRNRVFTMSQTKMAAGKGRSRSRTKWKGW